MRILWFLLLCLLTTPAFAQTAGRVRAIEHPNFSRLVFEIAPGTTWNSRQTGRESVLFLNGVKQQFDAASLFDRMSRSRILNFNQRPGNQGLIVEVELGCDCEIVIEKLAENQLALDVWRQGSRPITSIPQQPALPPTLIKPEPATDHISTDLVETPHEDVEQADEPSIQSEEELRLAGSIAAEARLLEEEIERIAQEGFLDLSEQHAQEANQQPEHSNDTKDNLYAGPVIPKNAPQHRSEIPFEEDGSQTRISSTLLDTEIAPPDEMGPKYAPAECQIYSLSNKSQRDPNIPVSDQLSHFRAVLINIDGSINEAAWRDLARFYISIGFGTEAIAALKELPAPQETDAVLADIARVVEDVLPAGSLLFQNDYCANELLTWRLASGRIPSEFDEGEVLVDLAALPNVIRKAVGLMISRHIQDQRPEFAKRIQNLIDRSPETEVPPSQEEVVKHLAEEALHNGAKAADTGHSGMDSETDGTKAASAEQQNSEPTTRVGDRDVELDLGIAARELSGTSPGLTATITLAKYEAETGNVLDAVTLLNQALDEYEFGSVEIYETGTELLLKSARIPEFKAQFVLAALAGRKFLLEAEHQEIVEARIAELGLPNLTLFR